MKPMLLERAGQQKSKPPRSGYLICGAVKKLNIQNYKQISQNQELSALMAMA
jgi:hypothetical protein